MDPASSSSVERAVLIVDDDDEFLIALRQAMAEGRGYAITLADTGEAALEALRREHFDVVILDYKMPGVSGLNVLQRMLEEKMDVPVVMLTGAGSESIAVEAMKMGAYDYVRKDQIDADHLCVLIDGVVERYLFRKEKQRRELIEREREMNLVAIEMFHMTLASVAQIMANSLSIVSLRLREHENRLRPVVTKEGQRQLSQVFGKLTEEHKSIALAVKSMLNMANALHGNFTNRNYAEKMQELINANLQAIQELKASKSSAEKKDEQQEG